MMRVSLVFFAVLLLSTSSLAFNAPHRSTRPGKRNSDLHQNTRFSIPTGYSPLRRIIITMSMSDSDERTKGVVITDLARYAIKGFSGDLLKSVTIPKGGVQTFPDDRKYALLKQTNKEKFDETDPEWLHKENFLCAFSAPELMASFRSHYEIVEEDGSIQRLLTLYRRSAQDGSPLKEPVLGPIDLNQLSGREELASFFSEASNEPLVCVTKESDKTINTFQFGNTRAGVKHNPGGDTRTVHIVNRATVREFSDKIGIPLDPMRFRPNIIIDGLEPWEEFHWVGKALRVVPNDSSLKSSDELLVKVLTRTVRCEGIGIDPLDPTTGKLDVPNLLNKNYPEHGPYLGVYASIEVVGGSEEDNAVDKLLSVGDTFELL